MPSAAQTYANAIRPLLRSGPAKAQALAQALQVSQPTVSRALNVEDTCHRTCRHLT